MDDAAPALGGAARHRRQPRHRAGRHRCLRHHRPDREGLPRLRLRARRRADDRRGRHAAAQGQGGRLRRQGGATSPSARRRPKTVLCTLTVEDHTSASGVQALHARRRADPDPRRRHADRRPRPPPLRHHGRLGAVAGQARAAGLPAARAGASIGNELAVSYMEELYPVVVGSVDATPCSTRPTSGCADADGRRARLRQAGSGLHRARSCSPRTRSRSTAASPGFTMSAARGVRRRARRPGDRGDRRRGRRCSPSGTPTPSEQLRIGAGRRVPRPRRTSSRPTGRRSARPTSRARSPRWSATTRPRDAATTWCCSATTPPTAATSRSGIRLAYELGRPVVNGASTLRVEWPTAVVAATVEGPEGARPTACRCRPW